VLWSPDYFSRLWCNYEVASFASLHGVGRIEFLPLYVPIYGLILLSSTCFFFILTYSFPDLLLLFEATKNLALVFFGLRAMRAQHQLTLQIEAFSLAQSRCYCCDVNHNLPDGTSIPCDRSFIKDNLNAWFCDGSEQRMDGVETLEHFVREVMSRQVRLLIGPFGVPLSTMSHLLIMQVLETIDHIFITLDANRCFRSYFAFETVFITSLIINMFFWFGTITRWLVRISVFSRDRIIIDVLLACIITMYSCFYVIVLYVTKHIMFMGGDIVELLIVTGLLFIGAWLNYKYAWQQGSALTVVISHCAPLVLSMLLIDGPFNFGPLSH